MFSHPKLDGRHCYCLPSFLFCGYFWRGLLFKFKIWLRTHAPPTHTHTHTLSFKWIEEEIPTKREEHDCFFPIYWLLVHLFVNLVPANDSSFKTISQKKIFFFSNVEKKRWRRQINIETIKINKVKTKKKNIFTNFVGWVR